MANDVERLVIEDSSVLPEELSSFNELIVTDTERLIGIDDQGKREQLSHLAHAVINLAAKATGGEVEQLSPSSEARRRPDRSRQPADIEAMVQRMVEERISAVTQAHEQQTESLQSEIASLRAEIERLQKPLHERLDEAFGDNWVPRDEDTAVARRGNDGYIEEGWATASQPYEKDGKWYIRVKKENNEEEAELAQLIRVQEEPDDFYTDTGDMPEGSRPVVRRRGWLGRNWDRARGRPVREYAPTGTYSDGSGRYIRRFDEEVVEVPPSEIDRGRRGALAVGALALAGASMVAGAYLYELLEHKYMGHSPSREMRNNGLWYPGKHGFGHFGHNHHDMVPKAPVTADHGTSGVGNGTHTDFFNSAPGHRRTAVEASSTIHLTGNPGDKTLKDGNNVLLRHVQFTKEGLISKLDRMRLRDKGIHVEWGRLQDTAKGIFRYKSVVSK